jgi:hypothetical protein
VLKKEETGTEERSACECCDLSSDAVAEQQDAEELNNRRKSNNDELLIVIGLVLTIPIVLIEIIFASNHSFVIDFIMLALAFPVQFILG